jgi:hypothetical protein
MIPRPYTAPGIGWILAIIVLLVAILSLVTTITVAHLTSWLIIGLALAILL